jgi:hypothetical protein
MLRMTLMTAAAVMAAAPAYAAVGDKLPAGLAKLSPDQIADRVQVVDDPLEEHVVFSTKGVFRNSGVKDDVAVHDGFLEARKTRAGGEVVWRVRHDLTYSGARRDVKLVHVNTPDGLLKIAPGAVRRWSEDCGDVAVVCSQHLSVEFDLPETAVRHIAAAWRPGDRTPWRVRFKDARGQDVTVGLAPVEVAGLVDAVDRARR